MDAYLAISCRILSVCDPKLPPKSLLSAFLLAISVSPPELPEFSLMSSSSFVLICCKCFGNDFYHDKLTYFQGWDNPGHFLYIRSFQTK